MVNLSGKSILITGGSGTVGQSLLLAISKLPKENLPKRVLILSRDEYKQYLLQKDFPPNQFPFISYALADVSQYSLILPQFFEIDIVIHAAALKRVETGEKQAAAFIQTNVIGTENVLAAALAQKVSQVITLSTDKAVYPTTLYGGTKLCAERVALQKNQPGVLKSSVIRLGNILGSRGSIVPELHHSRKNTKVTITHSNMTRFSMTASDCAEYILSQIPTAIGGEILIPKTSAYRLTDLVAEAVPNAEVSFSSPRGTEKIHETILSEEEARFGYQRPHDYVVSMDESVLHTYRKQPDTQPIEVKAHTSESTRKLSRTELAALILELYPTS